MNRLVERPASMKAILRFFWVIMYIIIVGVYILTQEYIIGQVERNVEKSIQGNIYSCEYEIEDTLGMIDAYIYENLYDSTGNGILNLSYTMENGGNEVDRQHAKGKLTRIIRGIDTWSDKVAFSMLYVDCGERSAWIEAGSSESFKTRNAIKDLLESDIRDGRLNEIKRYMVFENGGRNHILRFMKADDCYFVIGVSETAITGILKNTMYSDESIVFGTDENGKVIFSTAPMPEEVDFAEEGNYISCNGKKYLQTGHVSDQTGYYFGVLTDSESIQNELLSIRIIFFAVLLILSVFMMLSIRFIQSYVESPLRGIVDAMKEVEDGELDIHVSDQSPIKEFHQLEHSFNHMVARIQKLRIEKYETQLTAQKATMQYLQMQIKPHFYANLLNIIYSLAETRDYLTIQRISRAIVDYSRYMFRDATDLVELTRELEHVKCYMEIQEVRYKRQIALELDVKKEAQTALVPPFVIQCFVENSVKYAFSTKKNCLISVEAKLDEHRENLVICIRDNGVGYPERMLNQGYKDLKLEDHIGFDNILKRLALIYGDKAEILLDNENGAVTIVRMPYISLENMNLEDDEEL